jgi:CheY-like chemotaxis protein
MKSSCGRNLVETLRAEGYVVEETANGRAALECLLRHRLDVVFLDL